MSLLDRLRVLYFALGPRILGALVVDTSVTLGAGPVVHTVRISRFGFTYYRSRETLALAPDGQSAQLEGEAWSLPFFWVGQPMVPGSVWVEAGADAARYQLHWMGAPLLQTTRTEGEFLVLTQETAWSRGVWRLRRRAAT